MAEVVLDSVNKVYPNGFHAIHDLSIDINDGEVLVLVGPTDALPVTMRVEVLDDAMAVLTSCSIGVDAPEAPQQAGAAAAGAERGVRIKAGR